MIGWLGGMWVFLPERFLMSDHSLEVLVEWEQDSTCCIQVCLLFWAIVEAIWDSIVEMWGLVGSWERSRSRSFISDTASGDRPGVKLGMLPRGMYFLDAVRRI